MFTHLLDTSSSGSSTDGRIIIGVTMGGVILLLVIITVVLCVVILYMKRYQKKKASSVDDRVSYSATKLNTNVSIEQNPSYVINVDNNTIKPAGDVDVPITSNPSYNVHTKHMETIKMDTNPLYGVSKGSSSKAIKMDTNPSYGEARATGFAIGSDTNAQQSSCNATTIYDDQYVYSDGDYGHHQLQSDNHYYI